MPVVLHCLVWLVGSPFSPRNWEESTVKRVMRFLKFSHFFCIRLAIKIFEHFDPVKRGKKRKRKVWPIYILHNFFLLRRKNVLQNGSFHGNGVAKHLWSFRELLQHKMRNPWQFWKAALKFLVESLSQLRNHLSLSFVGSNDRIWASLFLCLFVFSWKRS